MFVLIISARVNLSPSAAESAAVACAMDYRKIPGRRAKPLSLQSPHLFAGIGVGFLQELR